MSDRKIWYVEVCKDDEDESGPAYRLISRYPFRPGLGCVVRQLVELTGRHYILTELDYWKAVRSTGDFENRQLFQYVADILFGVKTN